jgi:hypothetical protein
MKLKAMTLTIAGMKLMQSVVMSSIKMLWKIEALGVLMSLSWTSLAVENVS